MIMIMDNDHHDHDHDHDDHHGHEDLGGPAERRRSAAAAMRYESMRRRP